MMTLKDKYLYAIGRLAMARAFGTPEEVQAWTEHVRYWKRQLSPRI